MGVLLGPNLIQAEINWAFVRPKLNSSRDKLGVLLVPNLVQAEINLIQGEKKMWGSGRPKLNSSRDKFGVLLGPNLIQVELNWGVLVVPNFF